MSFGKREIVRNQNTSLIPQSKLDAIEKLLAQGDLSPMDQGQRLDYMKSMCKLLGISMLGQPFDFIKFNGKLQMFANAKSASQLRAVYKISIKIIARERIDGLYCVTAQGKTGKGREDESIGAINIKGLSGEALANALMKAETKAKRRVTLSLCGLGMLDSETAKEVAEFESKQVTERKVEESSAKLDETKARPEFETERETPSVEQPAPESAAPPEYRLRTVKGATGKTLKAASLKVITNWLKYYDDMAAKGEALHPHVQDDAFHIRAFLDESAIAQKEKQT